jgi:hypothetical protein
MCKIATELYKSFNTFPNYPQVKKILPYTIGTYVLVERHRTTVIHTHDVNFTGSLERLLTIHASIRELNIHLLNTHGLLLFINTQ